MTNEEAIELLYDIQTDAVYNVLSDEKEALDMAINVLKQQPCEDAISRADVKKYLSAPDANGDRVIYESDLDLLPSVQPTRPTGKWIEKEDYNLDTYYECSECGADYYIEGDILIHKYCPNCGAKMTESEDKG